MTIHSPEPPSSPSPIVLLTSVPSSSFFEEFFSGLAFPPLSSKERSPYDFRSDCVLAKNPHPPQVTMTSFPLDPRGYLTFSSTGQFALQIPRCFSAGSVRALPWDLKCTSSAISQSSYSWSLWCLLHEHLFFLPHFRDSTQTLSDSSVNYIPVPFPFAYPFYVCDTFLSSSFGP